MVVGLFLFNLIGWLLFVGAVFIFGFFFASLDIDPLGVARKVYEEEMS